MYVHITLKDINGCMYISVWSTETGVCKYYSEVPKRVKVQITLKYLAWMYAHITLKYHAWMYAYITLKYPACMCVRITLKYPACMCVHITLKYPACMCVHITLKYPACMCVHITLKYPACMCVLITLKYHDKYYSEIPKQMNVKLSNLPIKNWAKTKLKYTSIIIIFSITNTLSYYTRQS